jgi:dTMP kinase
MIIVIEGLDGSGKTTQVAMLKKIFEDRGKKFTYIHFPRYDVPIYGNLISSYLRGDFGDLNSVDPHLVALLYAGDRKGAEPLLRANDTIVILDRYVYSNIAYQCAKIDGEEKRHDFAQWVLYMEYDFFGIPKPNINIFLDIPIEVIKKRLKSDRKGEDRDYLQDKKDIHEADLEFQKKVRENYLKYVDNKSFFSINCVDDNFKLRTPESINKEIVSLIV